MRVPRWRPGSRGARPGGVAEPRRWSAAVVAVAVGVYGVSRPATPPAVDRRGRTDGVGSASTVRAPRAPGRRHGRSAPGGSDRRRGTTGRRRSSAAVRSDAHGAGTGRGVRAPRSPVSAPTRFTSRSPTRSGRGRSTWRSWIWTGSPRGRSGGRDPRAGARLLRHGRGEPRSRDRAPDRASRSWRSSSWRTRAGRLAGPRSCRRSCSGRSVSPRRTCRVGRHRGVRRVLGAPAAPRSPPSRRVRGRERDGSAAARAGRPVARLFGVRSPVPGDRPERQRRAGRRRGRRGGDDPARVPHGPLEERRPFGHERTAVVANSDGAHRRRPARSRRRSGSGASACPRYHRGSQTSRSSSGRTSQRDGTGTKRGGGLAAAPRPAAAAARAAADKQAQDIVILDVHELIVITDHFVICTATSHGRSSRWWTRSSEPLREQLDVRPARREGEGDAGWWLLDYIDVVVHVFGPRSAPTTTWNVSGATLPGWTGKSRTRSPPRAEPQKGFSTIRATTTPTTTAFVCSRERDP